MQLLIDAREACGLTRTGKGQWARGFIRALTKVKDIEITLLVEDHMYTDWAMSPTIMVRRFERGLLWHFRVLGAILRRELTGIYVSPTSFLVPFFAAKIIPTAIVVHDMIAFRGEPHDRKAVLIEKLTLGRAVKSAAKIFVISESTGMDLRDRYPHLEAEKIIPIFAGPLTDLPKTRMDDEQTILCVATLCPRKNQLRLIDAYAHLPDDLRKNHRLLLCGSRGWRDSAIVRRAQNTLGVEWKGHVKDEEYARLLSTCHVFALPSLYEGFGMQILDALILGVPVLTSNRGSLKEVAGKAAVIVDPENTDDIVKGLERILTDKALQKKLQHEGPVQAKRFTWERAVELFLLGLKDL